jgi:hypothetical protein
MHFYNYVNYGLLMNEFFFDVSDRWEHQQTQTDARSILTI